MFQCFIKPHFGVWNELVPQISYPIPYLIVLEELIHATAHLRLARDKFSTGLPIIYTYKKLQTGTFFRTSWRKREKKEQEVFSCLLSLLGSNCLHGNYFLWRGRRTRIDVDYSDIFRKLSGINV